VRTQELVEVADGGVVLALQTPHSAIRQTEGYTYTALVRTHRLDKKHAQVDARVHVIRVDLQRSTAGRTEEAATHEQSHTAMSTATAARRCHGDHTHT
jgi:hypothetical protein